MARSPIIKVTLGSGSNQLDISNMVTNLKYKRSLTHDDTVDIDIENQFADYLLEQPVCDGGQPVTFSYGYIGEGMSNPVTLFLGDIEPDYTPRGTNLSLSSVDASQAMKKLRSNKVWKNMTYADITKALAEIHGLNTEIQQFMQDPKSQQINLENSANRKTDSTTNAELQTNLQQTNPTTLEQYKNVDSISISGLIPVPFKKIGSFPQGWQSNHEFMGYISMLQGGGFISYVRNRTIYFVQKNTASPSTATVTMGSSDVISFKIKYREITGAGSEVGINNEKFDPKSTETIIMLGDYHFIGSDSMITKVNPDGSKNVLDDRVFSSHPTLPNGGGDLSEVQQAITNALDSAHITNIEPDDVKLYLMGKQQNAAIRQSIEDIAATAQEGVVALKDEILTATLAEEGNIGRDINTVLTIAGFATRYNGNWFIQSVEDDINQNGFITTSTMSKGEGSRGIVPTDAVNKVPGTSEKKRTVSVTEGWDYPAGTNVNAPAVNPSQNSNTAPSQQSNFTIKTKNE